MTPFEEAARDAGRALGDLGAGERSALVEEVAVILAELATEPARGRRAARRKFEIRKPLKSEARSSKLETISKHE